MIIIHNERYHTPQEVANFFHVNVSTVSRWRRDGELTSYPLNKRKHLFSEKQIEKFIKRNEENNG